MGGEVGVDLGGVGGGVGDYKNKNTFYQVLKKLKTFLKEDKLSMMKPSYVNRIVDKLVIWAY